MSREEMPRDVPLGRDILVIGIANYNAHSGMVAPEVNIPEA